MAETVSELLHRLSVPGIWGTLTSCGGWRELGFEERTSVSNKREERQCEEDSDISKCKRGVMQKESPSFPSEIPTWGLLGSAEHWAHRAQLSAAPPQSSSAPQVLAAVSSIHSSRVFHYKHLNGEGCCRHSLLNLFLSTTHFL